MIVRKRRLEPVDGASCSAEYVYPWAGVVETPFKSAWISLEPGESTPPQMHHDSETFFFVEGSAVLAVDDELQGVEPGDIAYLPPFTRHVVSNRSNDPVVFLTVWWEDMASASRAAEGCQARGEGRLPRAVVTSAPLTANGELHLGHLSGPYLGADVHTRYLRMRGVAAYHLAGTDDFQTAVASKARQMGWGPVETAAHFRRSMMDALAAVGIHPDHYTRPAESPEYQAAVQQVFSELHRRGHLVEREASCSFCPRCDRYLFDQYVIGACPHCGETCFGGGCEECGRPSEGVDLLAPRCALCRAPAEARPLTRLVFRLGEQAPNVRRQLERTPVNTHVAALAEGMFEDGLTDPFVTQPNDGDWGLAAPIPGFQHQVIGPWCQPGVGYLVGIRQLARIVAWADDDPSAPFLPLARPSDTAVVHFFGFDNAYHHTVLFPALNHALDPERHYPTTLVGNEFYRLEGAKFSTSRNHAIWVRELARRAPADAIRFYLCLTRPEVTQTRFTLAEFDAVLTEELEGGWQGWLDDLSARLAAFDSGRAPGPIYWTESHRLFFSELVSTIAHVGRAYEAATFSPPRATRAMSELVARAQQFGTDEARWATVRGRQEEYPTALALELAAARALAMLAAPIMPEFAARLAADLGAADATQHWKDVPVWVTAGTVVQLRRHFFGADVVHATSPSREAPTAVERGQSEAAASAAT